MCVCVCVCVLVCVCVFLCVCVCVCVAEFAAELRDFVEQEVRIYWPDLLPLIKMYILEASDRHPPPPIPPP